MGKQIYNNKGLVNEKIYIIVPKLKKKNLKNNYHLPGSFQPIALLKHKLDYLITWSPTHYDNVCVLHLHTNEEK